MECHYCHRIFLELFIRIDLPTDKPDVYESYYVCKGCDREHEGGFAVLTETPDEVEVLAMRGDLMLIVRND